VSGPVFKFCAPGLIFGVTEGIRFNFHVLRASTRFLRHRGREIRFSCFALPDSFSAVVGSRFLVLFASGLVFGGYEGAGYRFYVLRSRSLFPWYRGRRVSFSCFAHQDSFSAVPRASGPDFMFYAPELVFDGTEGVGSRFHVLRAPTRCRRYRGRRLTFSCFALPDSFSAVLRASAPVFTFCASGLIFGGTESVRSCFHVLHSRTRFRRNG
jgi:hypothetical protein